MIQTQEQWRHTLEAAGCETDQIDRILDLMSAGMREDVLCQLKKQRCVCMEQLHENQRKVDQLDRLIREQKKGW